MFQMTLEEFYQAFKVAHRKYPMHVTQDSHIRHYGDSSSGTYCPVTAVARNLVDTDSPIVHGKVLPKDFVPELAEDWSSRIGLSDSDAELIISAADDEIHISSYPQDDVKIKEIRDRMITICAENTSEHES